MVVYMHMMSDVLGVRKFMYEGRHRLTHRIGARKLKVGQRCCAVGLDST